MPQHDLFGQVRWFCLLIMFGLSLAFAPMLFWSHAPGVLRIAGSLALVIVCWRRLDDYLRGTQGVPATAFEGPGFVWWSFNEALCLFLIISASGNAYSTLGVVFSSVAAYGMYGTGLRAIRGAIIHIGAYLAATASAWPWESVSVLFALGPMFLLIHWTALTFVVASALRRSERSKVRERVLRDASIDLTTTPHDAVAAYAAGARWTLALAAPVGASQTALAAGSPERMTLVAESDASASEEDTNPHALPEAVTACLTQDQTCEFRAADVPALQQALGSLSDAEVILAVPLMMHQALRGTLLVISPAPLPADEKTAVQTMAELLGLAVTQNELAEETRRQEGQQQLSALVQHSSDLIAVVDPDGIVTFVTPSIRRLLGFEPDEVVGARLTDLIHPDDMPRAVEFLRQVMASEEESHRPVEWRLRGRNQSWVETVTVGANLTAHPAIGGLVLTIRGARGRGDGERRQAVEEGEERTQALAQMANGIAHELNQSLALIAGYAEMALQARGDSPRERADLEEALSIMVKAAFVAGDTVRRLQTFANQDGGQEPELLNLGELLREVAWLTAPRWRDEAQQSGRPISLGLELEEGVYVRGSAPDLRSVFTSLIDNAVDALPQGGLIALRLQRRDENVDAEVVDSGIGMEPEVQARALEPFFSTKAGGGMGLGLSVAQAVVGRHGGTLTIDSVSGRGTTVRVSLPPASTTIEQAPPAGPARIGRQRILAVDNEPALARMLSTMLTVAGHSVATATSGEQALSILAEESFDALVCNLGLGGGMDGWAVAAEVYRTHPEARVVLVTGWSAQIDAAEAEERHVAAVLSKPYRLADLTAAIGGVPSQRQSQ